MRLRSRSNILGSLDRVTRVVRVGVSLVTTAEFREHARVPDAASELLVGVFGAENTSTRLVFGLVSLPLGACVVLENIFEVGESLQSKQLDSRREIV